MNPSEHPAPKLVLRSAAELAGVTLLVFGIGWAGVRLAGIAHNNPVRAGRDGVIELRLAKSDRRGDVTFIEAGYSGWWNCRGKDWAVEWRFKPEAGRRYVVSVLVATPDRISGEKLEVAIRDAAEGDDRILQAVVPDTGGAVKWKMLELGTISPGDAACTLLVRRGSAGLTNLNLKLAMLRPMDSTT